MSMLPDIPCDVCKVRQCTHFFGNTSAALCDDPECFEEECRRFDEHCRKLAEQDEAE